MTKLEPINMNMVSPDTLQFITSLYVSAGLIETMDDMMSDIGEHAPEISIAFTAFKDAFEVEMQKSNELLVIHNGCTDE